MSRQDAEDGAYGFIAIAALAVAIVLQFIAPSSAQEQSAAGEPANKPYYEYIYTYPRLPERCKEASPARNSAECVAIRDAEPKFEARLHAPESAFAGTGIPAI